MYVFRIYTIFMKTSKGRGRPKKSSEDVKSESVLLRMSLSERQAFTEAASLAGVPLSVWIRERLRLVARQELTKAGKEIAFIE